MENDKICVIVFAGYAYTRLPITSDYISAKMFLETINPELISKQGTAIGAAINLAARSFTPQEGVGKAIIVITDGENHEGDALEASKAAAAKGIQQNNPEDGNLINAEGYTALEKYLGSLMGEELTGAFGDVTAIRTQYAVQFHYTFENGLLTIQGEDLTRFHLFDLQGICYMDRAIENTATIDLSALPANVYVMWVTNKGGYRNGVKLLKQ